jgi:hypothetical protein
MLTPPRLMTWDPRLIVQYSMLIPRSVMQYSMLIRDSGGDTQ